MASKPLNVLKKGLENFSKKIKTRKEALNLKLSRRESISEADEHWLDHEANTIDEERVLHDLETASDYERGIERLDEDGKVVVKKLREWAGDLMKVAGKKRKRTRFCMPWAMGSITDFCSEGSDHEKQRKRPENKPSQLTASAPVFTKKENATLSQ